MTETMETTSRALVVLLALGLGACGSAEGELDAADDAAVEATDVPVDDAPGEEAIGEDDARWEDGVTDVPGEEAIGEDDAGWEDGVDDVPEEEVADAPEEEIAEVAEEADVGPDGGCDPAHETPSPGGMCDGRGIMACQEWARTNGGETATAVCISAGMGTCARATDCDDTSDPTTCRCGTLPACVPGEVCVTHPDASPECKCATGM